MVVHFLIRPMAFLCRVQLALMIVHPHTSAFNNQAWILEAAALQKVVLSLLDLIIN